MRHWVLKQLLQFAPDPRFVFLTGDLGFNFLEPLRDQMGDRFINVGVAEQNMVSVAAGLAREGMRVFCYSISPFLYARAFEQIRIDLCLNRLPVQLIGSGAGFDYGSMGPEHHALEDYGVLSTLRDFPIYLPWNEESVKGSLLRMWQSRHPSYLRLDRKALELQNQMGEGDWQCLLEGTQDVFLCAGSSVIPFFEFFKNEKKRPSLWVLGKIPLTTPPPEFIRQVHGQRLFVIEEHVRSGGLAEKITSLMYHHPERPRQIENCSVHEVFSGLFGHRDFHWQENSLLPEQLKVKWQNP